MRKLAITAICAALALGLTGCDNPPKNNAQNFTNDSYSERFTSERYNERSAILTDTKTGVEYLVIVSPSDSVAITPLLNADGTPYVEGE